MFDMWPGLMSEYFNKVALATQITNSNYHGEIRKKGDEVQYMPAMNGNSYTGTTLSMPVVPNGLLGFTVDHATTWKIPVIDSQTRPRDKLSIKALIQEAHRQRRIVDRELLGSVYMDTHADNVLQNQVVCADNRTNLILQMQSTLDVAHSSKEGRWLVVPDWFYKMIVSKMHQSESMIHSDLKGELYGFRIYVSLNLALVAGYTQAIFGATTAITFATEFTKTETLRNRNQFGDLVQGRQVFGWKTVQPCHLGRVGIARAN